MAVKTQAVREKFGPKRLIQYLFVTVVMIAMVFPIYYIVVTSFMSGQEIGGSTLSETGLQLFPKETTINYYLFILYDKYWSLALKNSILTSLSNAVLCVIAALPVSYIFTRSRFVLDRWVFFWLLINRILPPGSFLVSFFMIYRAIGIYDRPIAVVLAHSLFNLPLAIWLLTGYMKDIPTTIDEQAFIDGYSMWGFWQKFLMPTMLPAIAVTAFFCWMFSWTEILLATSVTQLYAFTMPGQLLGFTEGYQGTGITSAAGVMSMVPGLVIMFFLRGYIARGFMLGGKVGR